MKFTIDESYLTDLLVKDTYSIFHGETELTEEQILKVLCDEDKVTVHTVEDHPEFTKLREKLEELGYIKISRQSWNGDEVIKSFVLNGFKFKVNQKFPCASALGNAIKVAKKFGYKHI